MKRLQFLSVVLFASLAFSQGEDTTKTIVVLKPVAGPQLHFRIGDYIVSCAEKQVLDKLAFFSDSMRTYVCSENARSLEATKKAIYQPQLASSDNHEFLLIMFHCLEAGNASVYRISDSRTFSQITIMEQWPHSGLHIEKISLFGVDQLLVEVQTRFITTPEF